MNDHAVGGCSDTMNLVRSTESAERANVYISMGGGKKPSRMLRRQCGIRNVKLTKTVSRKASPHALRFVSTCSVILAVELKPRAIL